MFNESDKVGIGVVIRNATGEIIATLSEKILKPASMAILKLLAARRAARFVQEIGLHQSHFEGDSKAGVKALQIRDSSFSSFGHYVNDILFFVSSLRSFLSHTVRQGNVVHSLAQRVRLSFPLLVWMEHISQDLESVVLANLSAL